MGEEGVKVGFGRRLAIVALVAMFVAAIPAAALATYDNPGTGTPGYWKNHPDAWPQNGITIGGLWYDRDDAIALMKTPGKGDKTYDLFRHLVAAKLNVLIGNDPSCAWWETNGDMDNWFVVYVDDRVGDHEPVKAKTDAWKYWGSPYLEELDDYNNGRLCAPHRD